MRFLLVLGLFAAAAHAGVHYTASGIFAPTVPTSFFTAPNQPWAMVFDTELNPTPILETGVSFNPPFTGFRYTLNGVNLGLTPASISFYDSFGGGGFVVRLTLFDEFSFAAPQMFTGSTTAPTMLYGTFVTIANDFDYLVVNDVEVGSLAGTTLYATPEPGTVALVAGGLLAAIAVRRRSAYRH